MMFGKEWLEGWVLGEAIRLFNNKDKTINLRTIERWNNLTDAKRESWKNLALMSITAPPERMLVHDDKPGKPNDGPMIGGPQHGRHLDASCVGILETEILFGNGHYVWRYGVWLWKPI